MMLIALHLVVLIVIIRRFILYHKANKSGINPVKRDPLTPVQRKRVFKFAAIASVAFLVLNFAPMFLIHGPESTIIIFTFVGVVVLMLFLAPSLRKIESEVSVQIRKAADRAEDVLASGRPPVVYLRPFNIDGNSTSKWSVLDIFGLTTPSDEFEIAVLASELGPFVGFGFPGEEIQSDVGAARVQVDHSNWKTLILDWMLRAKLIILVVGETEGVKWELETICENALLGRLIVILEQGDDESSIDARYEFMRNSIKSNFSMLPDYLEGGCAMHFANKSAPQIFYRQSKGVFSARAGALARCIKDWSEAILEPDEA